MLWLSGVKHYHSVFQHTLSGEKYAMQLRSFHIMDGCSLNATALVPGRERCSSSSVHPRGTIHWATDVEYLSSQPFLLLSAELALLHSDKLAVVSWVKKKKKKTCRATCTIGAFCHVFTDVPSGVTLKPNRSGSNRSATAAKSSWLSNSHWNVEECTQRINPSSSARFWLEVIAERQSGPRRQKKE